MPQDVVGVNGTRDFTEVMQGLAGIDCDKVAWHVVGQTLAHRLKRRGQPSTLQMTEVGDDQLVPLVVGLVGRGEQALECVDALSL